MFNWIPLEFYSSIYYQILLVVVLVCWIESKRELLTSTRNIRSKGFFGLLILAFTLVYIGFRPISGRYFLDMATYAQMFDYYVNGGEIRGHDLAFEAFMQFCSKIMTVEAFFLVCAALYLLPLYLAAKKVSKTLWFYVYLILICSFSFWGYGVNGIRNGIATSFVLMALVYRDKKIFMAISMSIGAAFHSTMFLPIVAFLVTTVHNDCKKYFMFWVLCIPLSLVAGGSFESIFGSLGFDERASGYLLGGNINDDNFSSTGFRWDFLIYSSAPVFVGYYFIFIRKFNDHFYWQLFNIYLIANAFWILVIRANFSNRFAYLSWFMMGMVVIYPLLKERFFVKQHQVLMNVIVVYFMFTYFMNQII